MTCANDVANDDLGGARVPNSSCDSSKLVRERAKVGSAAAMGDWPRRARRANALGGVVAGAV